MVAHECGSLLGWGVFVDAFVNAFVNAFATRSALWRGENHSDCHRYF